MTTRKTKKEIDESTFLFVRDNTTNNVQLVACPKNFQVGLNAHPADLILKGKLSLSEKDYFVNSGTSWSSTIDEHITIANVTTAYSAASTPASGYVLIKLPKNPRVGQLVIVKDFSGTSGTYPIRVYSFNDGTIDGSSYQTISTNYGSIQFSWNGTSWFSVSSSSNSGGAPANASYVVLSSDGTLTDERVLTAGSGISITDGGAGSTVTISSTAAGDVVGPASSTDNAVARFDLTTGKLIQNSGVLIDDSNNVTTPGDLAVNGGDITTTSSTFNLLNAASTLNIGTTAIARSVNLGTAAATQTVTVGGTTATSSETNIRAGSNSINLDSGLNVNVSVDNAFVVNGYSGNDYLSAGDLLFFGPYVSLTGPDNISTITTVGNSAGFSPTYVYGGSLGILLSSSAGYTTITGSTASNAEAIIGTAEIGEFPYTRTSFPNYFAMFGHKTLDHSINGNYAVLQSYNGDSFLNSPTTIYLQNAGNLIGYLDNNNISLTGQASTPVTTEIGSVYGVSSTTIKGGLFGLILTGSGTTITITGSTTTQSDVYIGSSEVGTHPFWGVNYAMFSHKDMNNSVDGNSALIQSNTGDTFLGAASSQTLYFKNGTDFIGTLDHDTVSFTGKSGTATATTVGNTAGLSSLTLDAGQGDISIGTSSSARNINIGPQTTNTTNQTVSITPVNTGNYNVVKVCDGASNQGHEVRIISENSSQSSGYSLIKIGTITNTCQTTIGNTSANSFTKIYGGANGVEINAAGNIDIATSATSRFVSLGTGGNSTNQYVTIGSTSGNSSVTINSGTGDIELDSNGAIRLQYNNSTAALFTSTFGIYSIDLTGPSSTITDVDLGNTYSTSSTTIQAGSIGTITIGNSTDTSTINIGNATTATGKTQTISVGTSATGTGKAIITIGNKNGASSTVIQSGAGDITLDSTDSIRLQYNGSTAALFTSNLGIYSIDLTGPSSTVVNADLGSTYSSSSTEIQAGTGGITMTGEVVMPNQPSFFAYRNTTSQLVPNTGATTVQFNAERFDTGSDFDVGTYTFTAPRTGKYVFNVSLRIDDIDTAATYYYVSLVTSNATYQLGVIDPNFSADLLYYSFGASVVADMDANDTALVQIRQSGGTSNQSSIVDEDTAAQFCSFFSGWLLG